MAKKTIVFYADPRGCFPVIDFLAAVDRPDRQKALAYIGYLTEQGEALRRPTSDYLGGKIYELRPRQLRILYAFVGQQYAVILHAFRKQTDAVPEREKRLAQARLADFLTHYEANQ